MKRMKRIALVVVALLVVIWLGGAGYILYNVPLTDGVCHVPFMVYVFTWPLYALGERHLVPLDFLIWIQLKALHFC
jgi:heme A synthase